MNAKGKNNNGETKKRDIVKKVEYDKTVRNLVNATIWKKKIKQEYQKRKIMEEHEEESQNREEEETPRGEIRKK